MVGIEMSTRPTAVDVFLQSLAEKTRGVDRIVCFVSWKQLVLGCVPTRFDMKQGVDEYKIMSSPS